MKPVQPSDELCTVNNASYEGDGGAKGKDPEAGTATATPVSHPQSTWGSKRLWVVVGAGLGIVAVVVIIAALAVCLPRRSSSSTTTLNNNNSSSSSTTLPPLNESAIASDWAQLTAGVGSLSGEAAFSTYDLSGQAFPALSIDGATVSAAARVGEGRVLTLGNEGVLARTSDAWYTFLKNAAVWLGGGAPALSGRRLLQAGSNNGTLRLATHDLQYASLLVALVNEMPSRFQPWQSITANVTAAAFLMSRRDLTQSPLGKQVNVFITDVYASTTPAESDALVAWVKAGGGLMVVGQAWYWISTNPGANVYSALPGNLPLVAMGLPLNQGSACLPQGSVAFDTFNATRFAAAAAAASPPTTPLVGAISGVTGMLAWQQSAATRCATAIDYRALTAGMQPAASLGTAASASFSTLVLSKTAVPVVATNGGVQVAAAVVDRGHIVVAGHEVLLNPSSNSSLLTVMVNAAAWAGRADALGRPVAIAGLTSGAADFITRAVIPSAKAGTFQPLLGSPTGKRTQKPIITLDEFLTFSSRVDVLIGDCYFPSTINATKLDALEAWVRAGGGFVTACHTWYWSYGGGDVYADNPANKLTTRFGIFISADVKGPSVPLNSAMPDLASVNGDALTVALLSAARSTDADAALNRTQLLEWAVTAMRSSSLSRVNPNMIQVLRTISAEAGGPPLTSAAGPAFLPSPNSTALAKTLALLFESARNVGPVTDLSSAPSPTAARFPGLPKAGALVQTAYSTTINGTYITAGVRTVGTSSVGWSWRSTGAYAPPGALVTVQIPAAAANSSSLRIQIGCHTDSLWDKASLDRAPAMVRVFNVNASNVTYATSGAAGGAGAATPVDQVSTTLVANVFGGLVYILVKAGATLGPVPVTMSGVVLAPRFVRGVNTDEQWVAGGLRDLPGPWAEFEGDNVVVTVRSEYASRVSNPSAVVAYYDRVLDCHATLANHSLYRPNKERMVTDIQISAGYMHSGMPFMAFMTDGAWLVNTTVVTGRGGNWGPYHEWGHNTQLGIFKFGDYLGEVTNNWFSLYASERINGVVGHGLPANAVRDWMAIPNRAFNRVTDPWTPLYMYIQLKDAFGWGLYQYLHTVAWEMAERQVAWPSTEATKINFWVLETCRYARVNLLPFYTAWGLTFITLDAATLSTCQALPPWTTNYPLANVTIA